MLYMYIYIYYNLVTEMKAAVAIISVSRSIYNKLFSLPCHIYFQNKGIRIRIRIRYNGWKGQRVIFGSTRFDSDL